MEKNKKIAQIQILKKEHVCLLEKFSKAQAPIRERIGNNLIEQSKAYYLRLSITFISKEHNSKKKKSDTLRL